MFETSRRNFLVTLGAFALAPLERVEPDLILHNGNFWTVELRNPRAQAVAISDGRFLAVGSNDAPNFFRATRAAVVRSPVEKTQQRSSWWQLLKDFVRARDFVPRGGNP
jgi:hypothetical protein